MCHNYLLEGHGFQSRPMLDSNGVKAMPVSISTRKLGLIDLKIWEAMAYIVYKKYY